MPVNASFTTQGPAMDTLIQLTAHYQEHVPGGISIGAPKMTIRLGNGTTVETSVLFLPIGNNLAITPVVTLDGDTALRIDLSRWCPMRYGTDCSRSMPFGFTSQQLAIRIARAFDADPATRWSDDTPAMTAWLKQWSAANNAPV
jgi:hypothetical protein